MTMTKTISSTRLAELRGDVLSLRESLDSTVVAGRLQERQGSNLATDLTQMNQRVGGIGDQITLYYTHPISDNHVFTACYRAEGSWRERARIEVTSSGAQADFCLKENQHC